MAFAEQDEVVALFAFSASKENARLNRAERL
jgi:hypothetical protein